ncbi:MAG: TM2 domain-containing protein [Gammaproteobacteria bacterium]|nr:TM2 domain-containing protein [Gammaproteobacteria bacterium]
MLNAAEVEAREESLRQQVRQLDESRRKRFYSELDRRLRDPDTYAVLNYLFIAGLHHFYLGKWLRGSINLVVFIAGLACLFTGLPVVGLGLLVGITVVELYALFRAQLIVMEHNNRLMEEILGKLRG